MARTIADVTLLWEAITPIRQQIGLYSTIGLYEFYQVLGADWERSPNEFGLKVQRDLQAGRQISIVDYTNAKVIREQQIQQFREIFKTIDLILTPTTPRTAPLLTEPIMQRDRKFVLIKSSFPNTLL